MDRKCEKKWDRKWSEVWENKVVFLKKNTESADALHGLLWICCDKQYTYGNFSTLFFCPPKKVFAANLGGGDGRGINPLACGKIFFW